MIPVLASADVTSEADLETERQREASQTFAAAQLRAVVVASGYTHMNIALSSSKGMGMYRTCVWM